jgi:beta-lactamase class D
MQKNTFSKLLAAMTYLVVTACATQPSKRTSAPEPKPIAIAIAAPHFQGMDGCAIVYDLRSQKIAALYGEERCRVRYPACSTFKWPLAVMAFDAGVLADENTPMKWDGSKRLIESWNQDQTAATWMKNSVVWYSQRITPQLSRAKLAMYLSAFEYGNQDISAGLTSAWLTITKTDSDPGKGSLKISAFEQIEFLKKFWTGHLLVSPGSIEKTKKITFIETSPEGFTLHGKTGSGYLPDLNGDFGWFIAHIEGHDREYLLVTAFTRRQRAADARFPGMLARDITKEILKDNSLW